MILVNLCVEQLDKLLYGLQEQAQFTTRSKSVLRVQASLEVNEILWRYLVRNSDLNSVATLFLLASDHLSHLPATHAKINILRETRFVSGLPTSLPSLPK